MLLHDLSLTLWFRRGRVSGWRGFWGLLSAIASNRSEFPWKVVARQTAWATSPEMDLSSSVTETGNKLIRGVQYIIQNQAQILNVSCMYLLHWEGLAAVRGKSSKGSPSQQQHKKRHLCEKTGENFNSSFWPRKLLFFYSGKSKPLHLNLTVQVLYKNWTSSKMVVV